MRKGRGKGLGVFRSRPRDLLIKLLREKESVFTEK